MKNFIAVFLWALIVASHSLSEVVRAQTWANLSVTVVLNGEIPPPKPMQIIMGQAIIFEDLVVDPATKGIANFVFMIDSKRTKLETKQLHPDLQEIPKKMPFLDIVNDAFVPHVMGIRAGQTIIVNNFGHNPRFNFFKNNAGGPMIQAGGRLGVATSVEEPGPTKVECASHPWMSGYVIFAGHPYVGVSDATGKIKIEKIPAGLELDFKVWHESQDKSIEEVTFMEKKETWKKGCVKLTLKEGDNDLGLLLIKPDRFKHK